MKRIEQRMWRAALAAALALAAPAAAMAETESGGQPGGWLSTYAGAHTLGMGGAFVATADDALGLLWNPAGLASMQRNELLFETSRLYEDTSLNAFGFAVPGSRLPSFGVAMVTLRSGAFERTNEMNDPLGTFDTGETAFLFTVSKHVTQAVAIGGNVKMVRQSVEEFSGGGLGFDLGGTWQVTPGLRLGASALNLGGPEVSLRDAGERWPMELRGGAALAVLGGRGQVAIEMDHVNGPGARFRGGAEYWIQPAFGLRAGFDDMRGAGGFSYRFGPQYQFDYAVADHALGMTHRVGLALRFGGFRATSKAEPEIFSPTGERPVTKISLNAHTRAEAENWTVEITDKAGQVVRRFGGAGRPPAHLQWDGKDEAGMPLADGVYKYQLTVKDAEGRVMHSQPRRLEISTGGPQGSVPVIPVE